MSEIPAFKFHAALTKFDLEYAALSWGGFNLFGDRKSIEEAKRLQHLAGNATAYREEIGRLRARADSYDLCKRRLETSEELRTGLANALHEAREEAALWKSRWEAEHADAIAMEKNFDKALCGND